MAVTGVPPSDAPLKGHTEITVGRERYVKPTLLEENCWPFTDISTAKVCAPGDVGACATTWSA
jgi:hypothetical protein